MPSFRNVAERVAWTFVQAAAGALPVTFALNGRALGAVGYAALAAGIAAVVALAKNLTMAPPAPVVLSVAAAPVVVDPTVRLAAAVEELNAAITQRSA